ncbi:MAG: hypothetical protein CL623_09385 [Arcobacter sp.]|nr:hypothetical protein [Arcobacter sp.]
MKISYHRRKKIKIRRIALKELIQNGIKDPKELALLLKVTPPTIKKDIQALKTMTKEDLTFKTKATSDDILEKKDLILKILDDENYYNESGEIKIKEICLELKTSRSTVLSVLNGE